MYYRPVGYNFLPVSDNLALYKPTGTYPLAKGSGVSWHAVDGDRRWIFSQNTCTSITIGDEGTAVFWVDLQAVYDISNVIVSGEMVNSKSYKVH
jgi:hypothetical protein